MAQRVVDIDGNIQGLIDSMSKLMYHASGIGLAANQVGVAKRVIIFDINYKEKGEDLTVLINPTIVLAEDKIVFEEGCLSVPDFRGELTRKDTLRCRALIGTVNPLISMPKT
jgi:peptide deformylase